MYAECDLVERATRTSLSKRLCTSASVLRMPGPKRVHYIPAHGGYGDVDHSEAKLQPATGPARGTWSMFSLLDPASLPSRASIYLQ